eukprot:6430180-Pyramimonas_sp.AAC.1
MDRQGQWQVALAQLSEMLGARLEPALICYVTPISACEANVRGDTLGATLGPPVISHDASI